MIDRLESMRGEQMYALDWETLFSNALAQWQEFLGILVGRNPEDVRLAALLDPSSQEVGS